MASPRIEIRYCTKCRFLLRAAWLAQELLSTFEGELAEVALVPATGGVLEVRLDEQVIASNREEKPMPEISQIKRLVRDRISPGRRIGHEEPPEDGGGAPA